MYVKHLATDMKIHRARQLLSRLATLEQDHLRSGQVRSDQPPPEELAQLAGTAVHTARSALDDLAFSLVVASRRTPRHTSFPIAASAHDFDEEQNRCVGRANPKARDAIRSVTPWKGADDKLWELHQLGAVERPLLLRLGRPAAPVPVRVPSALQVLQSVSSDAAARAPREREIRLVIAEGEIVRGRPVVESIDLLITHAAEVVVRVVNAAEKH